MALTNLPVELILMIGHLLTENDFAHLLQVNRHLHILLPELYRRHVQDNPHQEGFLWCIATGTEPSVQRFLSCGADVNLTIDELPLRLAKIPFQPWLRMQTPLSIAANIGNGTLVTLLLSHGAHVNGFRIASPNSTVQTAVLDALLSGHDSTVRLLLKHGPVPLGLNIDLNGLLKCAIDKGHLPLLKLLVEFGADVNMPCNGGYPLTQVASSAHLSIEILQSLLDNGAQIGLVDNPTGRLVDLVVRHGTIDTLRLLLVSGAKCWPDIFASAVKYCTPDTVRLLLAHGCTPSIDTLMMAVEAARADILQILIDSGVNLNEFDTQTGSTALHAAIHLYHPLDFSQVGRRVSYRALWPTRVPAIPSAHLPSPLPTILMRTFQYSRQQISARCYDRFFEKSFPEEIVRYLIRGGADLNALDTQGRTPLVLAGEIDPAVKRCLSRAQATEV